MVRTAATTIKTTGGKSSKGSGFKKTSTSKTLAHRLSHGSGNRVLQQPLPPWQRPILQFTSNCSPKKQDNSAHSSEVTIGSQKTQGSKCTSQMEQKILSEPFENTWSTDGSEHIALNSCTDSTNTGVQHNSTDEDLENQAVPDAQIGTLRRSTLAKNLESGGSSKKPVKHLRRASERKRARDPAKSSPESSDRGLHRAPGKKRYIRRESLNVTSDSSGVRIRRRSYEECEKVPADVTSSD